MRDVRYIRAERKSRSHETALSKTDVMTLLSLGPITLLQLLGLRHRRYSAPSLGSRGNLSPEAARLTRTRRGMGVGWLYSPQRC